MIHKYLVLPTWTSDHLWRSEIYGTNAWDTAFIPPKVSRTSLTWHCNQQTGRDRQPSNPQTRLR